jgi:hypothetical protein
MGPEQDPLASNPPREDNRSSSEIESDIRKTRGRLDNTLENLNERLNPRSLLNDVLNWFETQGGPQTAGASGDALKRGYRNVVRQVKENPMPALLIGTGIAWMVLRTATDESLENQNYDTHETPLSRPSRGEKSEPITYGRSESTGIASVVKNKTSQAREALSGATAAVTEKISEIGSGVQAGGQSAGDALNEGVRRGRQAAQHLQKGTGYAGDRFQDAVEEYPFAVAVGFLGVGVLAGLLLPRTRQEDKLLGEKSDQLMEQVKATGKETLGKAKEVVERVANSTLAEAKRQGITSETIGETVSEIAGKLGAVATQAKEEAVRAAEESN